MKKLRNITEYQKWVRPVETLNGTIRVKFGLAISQLVDVVSTALRCTENIFVVFSHGQDFTSRCLEFFTFFSDDFNHFVQRMRRIS